MLLFRNLVVVLLRLILRLRYRIHWRGLETIEHDRSVLFLPNHPSELDPLFLTLGLWHRFQPRPVAVEDFYYLPGVHWLMTLARVIPIPNVTLGGSAWQRLRLQQALDEACRGLAAGDNVLIYPAGRMMHSGLEDLRGASAAYDILQRVPEARVVRVRTRGLIGSSFAWATQQRRPDLGQAIKRGMLWTLANLVVFNPRRDVTIEFEEVPRDDLDLDDKQQLNRQLEAWYNAHGEEELDLVSLCRWKRVVPEPAATTTRTQSRQVTAPREIQEQVRTGLAAIANREPDAITPDMSLTGDLAFDSLNLAETVSWLEETFFVTDVDPEELNTVQDVIAAAVGAVEDEAEATPPPTPEDWLDHGRRQDLLVPAADDVIPRLFLRNCGRMPRVPAIGDETMILTYGRVRLGAILLATVIRRCMPEERIGIMLPASAGATVVSMAVLLAGKTPVMINWTLGDANLEHVLKSSGIKTILSSGKFLDRVDQLNFDLIQDYLMPLERLRQTRISLRDKLRAFALSKRGDDAVCRACGCADVRPDDHAVILYTSGSESTPKAVPLTHHNVLMDIRGALQLAKLTADDSLYGFLPPFHSFGFTVAGVMPVVIGLKTAYYPNPTKSRALARGVASWRPTLMCGTPTFIAGIFKRGRESFFESLRLVVCGAEATPQQLFDRGRELGLQVLEGYGITETSPVLTLTPPDHERVGVGQPLPGVELRVVDVDTREPLPTGERGLILAHGPNVFNGYLDRDNSDTFHHLDGRDWYITGDLGYLDAKGNLTLSGRLKRFVKIAGEMVSLPAIENAITDVWPHAEDGVSSAVIARESDGDRTRLFLVTTWDISRDDVNAVLKKAGFPNLVRISDVLHRDEIPVLGTGKTDYQTLQQMLPD